MCWVLAVSVSDNDEGSSVIDGMSSLDVPGAGKSTLVDILAGRRKTWVSQPVPYRSSLLTRNKSELDIELRLLIR